MIFNLFRKIIDYKKYNNLYFFLLIGLLVRLFGVFSNPGHHHPDEHFQILEFLESKLSHYNVDLPWEFSEQIRPWLQPAILFAFIKPLTYLGLDNRIIIYAICQLLTLGFFVIVSCQFIDYLKRKIPENNELQIKVFLFWLFAWYMPYLGLRVSSETWSSFAFLSGYFLLERKNYFRSGLLMSFSFLFRYQMALLSAPLLLVYFFQHKQRHLIIYTSMGVLIGLSIGQAVDYWGYGEFQISYLNYFKVNLIEGKANSFGQDPWWFYFYRGLIALPILSSLMIFLFFVNLWKNRSQPLVIGTAFFFLIHTMIAHKEFRFIFPIAIIFPLFLVSLLKSELWVLKILRNKLFYRSLLILNFIGMISLLAAPPRSQITLMRFFYQLDPLPNILYTNFDPLKDADLPVHFYRPKKDFKLYPVETLISPEKHQSEYGVFFASNNLITDNFNGIPIPINCTLNWVYPSKIIPRKWLNRVKISTVSYYLCRP